MTNFILSGSIFAGVEETGELKKEDKNLIILMELAKYLKENNIESIRYSQLRDLSDKRLNEFSAGFQTNYGGAFEIYIKKFEKQGYLRRVKKSPGKSLIFPDLPKIESLIDKKRLRNSFDKMDVKAIYESPFSAERPQIQGGILIPDAYKLPNHLVKRTHSINEYGSQDSISLLSIPWKIYIACNSDRNFQLSEEAIQNLLSVGKSIASKDKTTPFKIILEYNGST